MPGVYLSYPFCSQKCTYCNFASGVMPEGDYLEALAAEIQGHEWQWLPETVYLGGGTPSRMEVEALARVLSQVPGAPWREATLEVAPGCVTAERATDWVRAGITRVSLGVQSFVQEEIARTGRKHTAAIVADEVALLKATGITEINIDLIAGLAGQTREGWLRSLDWLERIEAPHVSIYMLEVDEESRLGRELLAGGGRYGAGDVPSDAAIVEFYEEARERLDAMGIRRYEISNFARPGHESVHNLKYWRLEPYVGFGADAHSFDGAMRRENVATAAEYVDRWRAGNSVLASETAARLDEERFFVGLRLSEGIVPAPGFDPTISRFVADGLLERDNGRLKLTNRGVLVSNEVFQEFLGL